MSCGCKKNCINVFSATGNIILTQIITNIFSVLVYFLPTTSAGSHEIHLMCLQLLIHNIVFTIYTQIYMIPQGLLLRPFDLTPLTKLHYPLIYTTHLILTSPGLLLSITTTHYFWREYHFSFTPTFSNTLLGRKTRPGLYMSPNKWGQMSIFPQIINNGKFYRLRVTGCSSNLICWRNFLFFSP